MANPGEKVVTSNDFETRLKNLEMRLNSILSGVAVDAVNGEMKNFLIQSGTVSVPIAAAGVAVTFPIPYSVAPCLAICVNHATLDFNVNFFNLTAAGFSARGFNRTNGANSTCKWIAFGKRG